MRNLFTAAVFVLPLSIACSLEDLPSAADHRCEEARALIRNHLADVEEHFQFTSTMLSEGCPGERETADGLYVIGVQGLGSRASTRPDTVWVCAVTLDPATQFLRFQWALDCDDTPSTDPAGGGR